MKEWRTVTAEESETVTVTVEGEEEKTVDFV